MSTPRRVFWTDGEIRAWLCHHKTRFWRPIRAVVEPESSGNRLAQVSQIQASSNGGWRMRHSAWYPTESREFGDDHSLLEHCPWGVVGQVIEVGEWWAPTEEGIVWRASMTDDERKAARRDGVTFNRPHSDSPTRLSCVVTNVSVTRPVAVPSVSDLIELGFLHPRSREIPDRVREARRCMIHTWDRSSIDDHFHWTRCGWIWDVRVRPAPNPKGATR